MNDALRAKFLDLKEGAIVVSLESFQHGGVYVSCFSSARCRGRSLMNHICRATTSETFSRYTRSGITKAAFPGPEREVHTGFIASIASGPWPWPWKIHPDGHRGARAPDGRTSHHQTLGLFPISLAFLLVYHTVHNLLLSSRYNFTPAVVVSPVFIHKVCFSL